MDTEQLQQDLDAAIKMVIKFTFENEKQAAEIERLNKMIDLMADALRGDSFPCFNSNEIITFFAKKIGGEGEAMSYFTVAEAQLKDLRLLRDKQAARIAELVNDTADADTYIRKSASTVLTELEVNGDSLGVPSIEGVVDNLVLEIKARDFILLRNGVILGIPCKECTHPCEMPSNREIGEKQCLSGLIAFAKREIEKEQADDGK